MESTNKKLFHRRTGTADRLKRRHANLATIAVPKAAARNRRGSKRRETRVQVRCVY